MVEHYNKRIQNIIQKELFKANSSIKIAVAWFTNDLLFQPLLLKLQIGVSVELVLNKDKINDSEENDIDFSEFIENGGVLHWNDSKRLMHEKFCIIDGTIVIYGSYNWTNKAELNDESIAVSRCEQSTTDFYLRTFEKLCKQYPAECSNVKAFKQGSPSEIKNDKSDPVIPAKITYSIDHVIYEDDDVKIARCERTTDGEKVCCIIDSKSNTIISKYYDLRCAGNSGWRLLIALKDGDKWYLYDTKNHVLITSESYDDIRGSYYSSAFFVCKNKKWGIVNNDSQVILNIEYDSIVDCGKQTYRCKYRENGYIIEKNHKYGLFAAGKMIFECIYDKLSLNGEESSIYNGKQGMINTDGEIILDFEYDKIQYYYYNYNYSGSFYFMQKGSYYGVYLIDLSFTAGCISTKVRSYDYISENDIFDTRKNACFVQHVIDECLWKYRHDKWMKWKELLSIKRTGGTLSISDYVKNSPRIIFILFYNDESSKKDAERILESAKEIFNDKGSHVYGILSCVKEIESARDIKNLPSLDTFPSAVLAINGRILSYWDGKKSMKNWLSDNRILLLL